MPIYSVLEGPPTVLESYEPGEWNQRGYEETDYLSFDTPPSSPGPYNNNLVENREAVSYYPPSAEYQADQAPQENEGPEEKYAFHHYFPEPPQPPVDEIDSDYDSGVYEHEVINNPMHSYVNKERTVPPPPLTPATENRIKLQQVIPMNCVPLYGIVGYTLAPPPNNSPCQGFLLGPATSSCPPNTVPPTQITTTSQVFASQTMPTIPNNANPALSTIPAMANPVTPTITPFTNPAMSTIPAQMHNITFPQYRSSFSPDFEKMRFPPVSNLPQFPGPQVYGQILGQQLRPLHPMGPRPVSSYVKPATNVFRRNPKGVNSMVRPRSTWR